MPVFDSKVLSSPVPNVFIRAATNLLIEKDDLETLILLKQRYSWLQDKLDNFTHVTVIEFANLMETVAKHHYDPNFSIELGKRLPPQSLGLAGNLIISAPTLRVAIESVMQFPFIIVPFLNSSCGVEGDEFVVRVSFNVPISTYATEFILGLACGTFNEVVRFYTGKPNNLSSISIMSETPPKSDYKRLFNTELVLGQSEYRINIPLEIASLPSPFACPELFEEYTFKCLNQVVTTGKQQTYIFKIKEIIYQDLAHQWTLKEVSQQLNMSVSTLKRKLESEGRKFRDIISEARFNTAKNRLTTTNASVEKIAHDIGYSDTSNFCAAFKRQENMSPGEYREKSISR